MKRHFYVYQCGDPYSRAAEVTEAVEHGHIYRGDLSYMMTCRNMESKLRRMYPGCKVTRGYP